MFFLSHYVQAVNIMVQCFNERLGSFYYKQVFSAGGNKYGKLTAYPVCGDAPASAACLELRSSALEQGQG